MKKLLLLLFYWIRPLLACVQDCNCSGSVVTCSGLTLSDDESWPKLMRYETELFIQNSHIPLWNITETVSNRLRYVKRLSLVNCKIGDIVVTTNSVGNQLDFLSLRENRLTSFVAKSVSSVFPSLTELDLSDNELGYRSYDVSFRFLLHLKMLNLSRNSFSAIPEFPRNLTDLYIHDNIVSNLSLPWLVGGTYSLRVLDLHGNALMTITDDSFKPFSLLQSLNLSSASVTGLYLNALRGLQHLAHLDLSKNSFETLKTAHLIQTPRLSVLNISYNPLELLPEFPTLALKELVADGTNLDLVLLKDLQKLSSLTTLSLSNSARLVGIFGQFALLTPSLRFLYVRNLSLSAFTERSLFTNAKLSLVDFAFNRFACDCRALWMLELEPGLADSIGVNLSVVGCEAFNESLHPTAAVVAEKLRTQNCSAAGVAGQKNGHIVLGLYGSAARLSCEAYGIPEPKLLWRRLDRPQPLFLWDPQSFRATNLFSEEYAIENGLTENRVRVLPGGVLEVSDALRADIGVYRCDCWNDRGNSSIILRLRLDYSCWTTIKIYCVICGILTAIAFFILNGVYASVRQCVRAHLSKLERSSKVKMMLEAMEKYRQRQVETLHQKYANHVQLIRDNYSLQMEQLRKGYAQQSERFRSYKEAQFGHIGSVYDNYSVQVNKARDYGHRQLERLYENYQQQLNRIRAFSLQQRLRLMRQYQVQQKYLDKLLKGLNFYDYYQPSDAGGSGVVFGEGGTITLSNLLSADGDLKHLGDICPDPDVPCSSNSTRSCGPPDLEDAASLLSYHSLTDDVDLCWPQGGGFTGDDGQRISVCNRSDESCKSLLLGTDRARRLSSVSFCDNVSSYSVPSSSKQTPNQLEEQNIA